MVSPAGHMISKANQRLYILQKYTRVFNRKTLRQLYNSYVRTILEYGSQVWTFLSAHAFEDIENIQLAPISIITGMKMGTSHDMRCYIEK